MGRAIKRMVTLFAVAMTLVAVLTAISRHNTNTEPEEAADSRLRIPVLMYHHIDIPPQNADKFRLDLTVTPQQFRLQMAWLRESGYTPITPEQYVAAVSYGEPLPRKPILLTFDDGYRNAYEHAFPILKEFGFVGTFFVVTDWIALQERPGIMTWAQVKEMHRAGMAIHSHSREHQDMRGRNQAWFDAHILASYIALEEQLGIQVRLFCFPSGKYDAQVLPRLRKIGVMAAFTTQDGTYPSATAMLEQPRVRIRGSHTLSDFAYLVRWRR
jgi:peptidoglycan/xylan/chitin deacetylase (PgdA/CDA1 family)